MKTKKNEKIKNITAGIAGLIIGSGIVLATTAGCTDGFKKNVKDPKYISDYQKVMTDAANKLNALTDQNFLAKPYLQKAIKDNKITNPDDESNDSLKDKTRNLKYALDKIEKISALEGEINNAKEISESLTDPKSKEKIDKLIQDILKNTDLNNDEDIARNAGIIRNNIKEICDAQLQNEKNEALKQATENFSDLNSNQLKDFETKINNSTLTTEPNIKKLVEIFRDLNASMKELNTIFTKYEHIYDVNDVNNKKYKGADSKAKKLFDDAWNNAKNIAKDKGLNENKDQKTVQQVLKTLQGAFGKLFQVLDSDLEQKINNAINEIEKLKNINNNQKNFLKSELSEALIKNEDQISNVLNDAKNLDAKMKDVSALVNQTINKTLGNEVQNNYDVADDTLKEAFKNAAKPLQDVIDKEKGENKTLEELYKLVEGQQAAFEKLNGEANINKAINELNDVLTKDKNLNTIQKGVLTVEINNLNKNKNKYSSLKNFKDNFQTALSAKISALSQNMNTLRTLTAEKAQVIVTPKFINADKNLQDGYTSEVDKVQLDKLTENNVPINQAITKITEAKSKLNGDAKLAQAKSNASDAIDALSNLNTEVISKFKEEISKANDVAAINNIKDKAVAQNKLAGDIVNSLSQAEALKKNTSVYNKATAEQKQNLEAAIKDVKDNILDSSTNKMKPNNFTEQLQAKKEAIDNAIKAINNLSYGITAAQNKAKEEINKLPDLTPEQKDALNAKVDSAITDENIDSIAKNAKTLDTATKALKEAIEKAKQVDKQANNYQLADSGKQKGFDEANLEAANALSAGLGDKDASAINNLAKNLTDSINNLNGDAKFNTNKDAAKDFVDKLDNLTKEQKESIKGKIANVKGDSEIKELHDAAEKLNKALKEAQEAAQAANKAKDSNNYKQASQTPKSDFDSMKQTLDSEIETAKGTNSFNDAKVINDLADKLIKATENSNNAKDALDGEKLLADARAKAQDALEKAKHLSEDHKKALQKEITDAKEATKLDELATNISTLDTTVKALKEAIEKAKVLPTDNYIYSDGQFRSSYTKAIQEAQEHYETYTNNQDIAKIIENISTQKKNLNGDIKLEKAKKWTEYSNLNNAQLSSMKEQLKTSKFEKVDADAKALDDKMHELSALVKKAEAIKTDIKYINDTSDHKEFDAELEASKKLLNKTEGENKNLKETDEQIKTLEKKYNALNGRDFEVFKGDSSEGVLKKWKGPNNKVAKLSNRVKVIEKDVFTESKFVPEISLPDSLKEIKPYALNTMYKLKSISIPDSVTEIGEGAFLNDRVLESVKLSSNITKISQQMFEGASSLKEIVIPDKVTEIGQQAFHNCTSLEKVTIPESVTKIGLSAFNGCESLKSIVLPKNIIPKSVGEYAFKGCTSLTEVTMPKSFERFKNYYFKGEQNHITFKYYED
ncbi:leucine-rich repeat protein [Mycoplasma sp. Z473B]|uniref:leucine-rich repeat protein n=1 Tax=Mycoplasma sp. Z473B TaxID=3401667 RepID=UPI003AADA8BF